MPPSFGDVSSRASSPQSGRSLSHDDRRHADVPFVQPEEPQPTAESFTLSFAAQGTGHRVSLFRCTPDKDHGCEHLTHSELLDALDSAFERECPAVDDAIGGKSGPEPMELSVRDVCKVDPQFSALLDAEITVRGQTVLLSLGSQRFGALLLKSEAFLLAPDSSSEMATGVQRRLRNLLEQGSPPAPSHNKGKAAASASNLRPPFQATALEAILLSAMLVSAVA